METKSQEIEVYNIKRDINKFYNKKLKIQCKREIINIIGISKNTFRTSWMPNGVKTNRITIETVRKIVNKYLDKQEKEFKISA